MKVLGMSVIHVTFLSVTISLFCLLKEIRQCDNRHTCMCIMFVKAYEYSHLSALMSV